MEVDSLAPFFDNLSKNIPPREDRGYFRPNHAILIFKDQIVSFIDLCFEYQNFICSNDLDVKNNIIDIDKWVKLEFFFKNRKLQYLLK